MTATMERNEIEIRKGYRKEKKERFEAQISVTRHHISEPQTHFLIFFFLFFFFFLLVCTGPKHLYRPKQPDFTRTSNTRTLWPVFFLIQNKGSTCIGALASMVYTGRTNGYGTKFTSLTLRVVCECLRVSLKAHQL